MSDVHRPMEGSIVLAVPDFEPSVGGTTRLARLLGDALMSRRYEVKVLTRRRSASWAGSEKVAGGLPVRRVGLPGRKPLADKASAFAPASWLMRTRDSIAVLHTLMWPDLIFAAASAGLLSRTVFTWAAVGEPAAALKRTRTPFHRAQAAARRKLMLRCRHVALTHAIATELRGLGVDDVATVGAPLDTDLFRPPSRAERRHARAQFGLAEDEFTVVYVGHLRALKAVDRLIAAFGGLDPGRHRLLLVGGSRGAADDVEADLRAQVSSSGLDEAVSFCGVLRDPRPAYWAADAFVLPSTQEGMPMSLIEAMACGVACVAPPSAGGEELLAGDGGIVPPSNSSDALLSALRDLEANAARRERLANVAAGRAKEYDVGRVATRYEQIYRDLADDA